MFYCSFVKLYIRVEVKVKVKVKVLTVTFNTFFVTPEALFVLEIIIF